MEKKWTFKNTDEQRVSTLQSALKIHPAICRLLVQRGIETYQAARSFFRTDAGLLHDPFLMKDMDKAVAIIHAVIEQQEKILIYGDYDVDGTTAVALVYSYFKSFYENIEFYIPHRFSEGYGVSEQGIAYAVEQNVSLIITLDCGIKSTHLIDVAREQGINVIVCDHHMPDEELPRASAILNPKQKDCPYPFKDLCGCGVGYKLISAYDLIYQTAPDMVNAYLDLLATAIAADIVPIQGENRALCVLGLQQANSNPSIALQALKKISGTDKAFTISDLVFIIAPRVNAAGRMHDAKQAVALFIEKDQSVAERMAMGLQENNNERRDIDKQTTEEALSIIDHDTLHRDLVTTVIYQPHWHKGVIGIVASRLIEHHYRPTIVLTHSNGKISGSARSIKGFNLFEGLTACASYLDTFGGHYFAAGLTLSEEHLEGFRSRFDAVVRETLAPKFFEPEIEIDAELQLSEINPSFVNILKQFAPHGPENMTPVFLTRKVKDYQRKTTLVKDKHIRFQIQQHGSVVFTGIGFNMGEKIHLVKNKESFDIIYHIDENEWNGLTRIQLRVLDIR